MKKQEVEGGKGKRRVTADGRMVVISSSDEKDHESRVWSSVFIQWEVCRVLVVVVNSSLGSVVALILCWTLIYRI